MDFGKAKVRNRTAARCRSNNERFKKRRASQTPAQTYTSRWDNFWIETGLSLLAILNSLSVGFAYLFRANGGARLVMAFRNRKIVSSPTVVVISALILRLCLATKDTSGRALQMLPNLFGFSGAASTMIDKHNDALTTIIWISAALGGLFWVSVAYAISHDHRSQITFITGYIYAYTVMILGLLCMMLEPMTYTTIIGALANILESIVKITIPIWMIVGIIFFAAVFLPLLFAAISLDRTLASFLDAPRTFRVGASFACVTIVYAMLCLFPVALGYALYSILPENLTDTKEYAQTFSPNGMRCKGSLSRSESFLDCKLLFFNVSNANVIIDGMTIRGSLIQESSKNGHEEMGLNFSAVDFDGVQSPPFVLDAGKAVSLRVTFSNDGTSCIMIERVLHVKDESVTDAFIQLDARGDYHYPTGRTAYPGRWYEMHSEKFGPWKIDLSEVDWKVDECGP